MLETVQGAQPRTHSVITFTSSGMMARSLSVPPLTNEHALRPLDHRATILRVEREDEIVAQDEAARYCYLIVSGCARTVQLMEDGRRHVGEFMFAGDIFGMDVLDRHDFSVEAVSTVTVRRYVRNDVEILADQDRDVSRWLREISARRMRASRDHMVLLGRKTASERIASFLLEMSDRIRRRDQSEIELPMSRADMGDYLGLTIETVCRRLTRLRDEGTIAIKGSTISICDQRALGAADRGRLVH